MRHDDASASLPSGFSIKRADNLNAYEDWRDEKELRKVERESARFGLALANKYEREFAQPDPKTITPEALRFLIGADLESQGFTLEDALTGVRRGRPTDASRPSRDALSIAVALLRDHGVTLVKIGKALDKSFQTVAHLETYGRELRNSNAPPPEPPKVSCRRHVEYLADCPACERANA